MTLAALAALLAAWALFGETDPAVGRLGLVALGAVLAAGAPRARGRRGAGAGVALAVALLPLALAARVDVALGASPAAALGGLATAAALVALGAAGAQRGGPAYAWTWLALVLAVPALAATTRIAGSPGSAAVDALAALSPLTWAARAASRAPVAWDAPFGAPAPWAALGLAAALVAIPRRPEGDGS